MPIRYWLRAANGQDYPITGPFRIGREPECQIQIDNNLVSRIHASIWIDHDHLLLRDERSRNGTQLNGEPMTPGEAHYLHHDDTLTIGGVTYTVVSDPPYPRPRQHRGLPGLPEDEPPPTAHVEKPSPAPEPPPPSAAAMMLASNPKLPRVTAAQPIPTPSAAPPAAAPAPVIGMAAPPARARVPLIIGGCVLLALLAGCCLLTVFFATAGRPFLNSLLHLSATPLP
jgi:hypothetical protein